MGAGVQEFEAGPVKRAPNGRWRIYALWALGVVVLIGGMASLAALSRGRAPVDAAGALTPDPGTEALSIPEFVLTDQDGRMVTREDLLGRLTVMDFFFTNCPFVCVPMSRNMKRAQDALAGVAGGVVRFVSVSVDPEHDTPERLREYSKEIGADLSTWSFLSGDEATISAMARSALQQEIRIDSGQTIELPPHADGAPAGTMQNIGHPSHFILIGPDARILGIYQGTVPVMVDALIDRARRAAKEMTR